jgi:hypothetical protein
MSYSSWSGNGTCDHRDGMCNEILVINETNYKKWECTKCGGGHLEDYRSFEAPKNPKDKPKNSY